jgi:hypothetical protein
MTIIALDWNATRIRAVLGLAGEYPLPVPLEPPEFDLKLAIAVEKGSTQVGASALRMCRSSAHLVCQGFLPFLTGRPGQGPKWQLGRQTLDARGACELVWRRLQSLGSSAQGILLAVPGYLQPMQVEALQHLGEQAGLPLLGSVPATLAAAMAGHAEQFWQKAVIVVDADDHALTIGWVKSLSDKAHLLETQSHLHLGKRFWKDKLINSLADLFVWQHRLDPRDSPMAEQSLFDQLDVLLDAAMQHRAVQLGVQSQHWFKHLLVHPEQTVLFCEPLVQQVVREVEQLMLSAPVEATPRGILLTHQAGRLPGLLEALQALVRPQPRSGSRSGETELNLQTVSDDEDFGDELLQGDVEELAGVLVLPPEAPARAVHSLAELFRKGTLPRGHLETIAPLLAPQPVDNGPARLHFQGRDFLLLEAGFFLGSQFGCHLYFDRHEHPEVAPRHCEIVYERRAFVLHLRSSHPTLVNDRPVAASISLHAGDRIRLGVRGPVLRFLGHSLSRPMTAVRG